MNLVNNQSNAALRMASVSRERNLEQQIQELKREQMESEQQLEETGQRMEKLRSYWLNVLKTTGVPLIKFGTSGKPKRRKLRIVDHDVLVWGGRKKRSVKLSDIRSAKRGIRMCFLSLSISLITRLKHDIHTQERAQHFTPTNTTKLPSIIYALH